MGALFFGEQLRELAIGVVLHEAENLVGVFFDPLQKCLGAALARRALDVPTNGVNKQVTSL